MNNKTKNHNLQVYTRCVRAQNDKGLRILEQIHIIVMNNLNQMQMISNNNKKMPLICFCFLALKYFCFSKYVSTAGRQKEVEKENETTHRQKKGTKQEGRKRHTTHLRFEIAMHNAFAVHEVNSTHQLVHDVHGLNFREKLLALDARQQLTPFQQFHHHIRV